jgi:hypothetical protein
MTYNEHERAAYMAGDYKTATTYAKLHDLQDAIHRLMGVLPDSDDAMVLDALDNLREVLK